MERQARILANAREERERARQNDRIVLDKTVREQSDRPIPSCQRIFARSPRRPRKI